MSSVLKADDVLENPDTGETIIVRVPSAETNGELFQVQIALSPRAPGPPPHVHPRIDERFKVLEGTMTARVGGAIRTLTAGEEVVVEKGTAHHFWNETDEVVRFEGDARPALRMEPFIATVCGLARDGRPMDIWQGAVFANEYWDVVQPARKPPGGKLTIQLLALLGRVRGRRTRFPEYPGEGNTL